ncbi:MSP domain and PapD-like domain-containing protein [Strongyloides ratti]|uniref:Major sperm protein n=1 Tax=Strongyloides ratti TaxID=34506 RepID=A0A090L818_STRRB|nr:MSP domain and PapD-like domain-containing protein [Strongyloides ratti]CEF64238.1 MSP domain and PapD-like domain-containing protein [Strongyloides ratti]
MDITLIQLFFTIFFNLSLLSLVISGCNSNKTESSNKRSKSKSKSKSKKSKDLSKDIPTKVPVVSENKKKVEVKVIDNSKKESPLNANKSKCQKVASLKNKTASIKTLTSTQSTSSKKSTDTFSFSNPAKLTTQEKNDQRKQMELAKNLKEWQAKNNNQIIVTMNKNELRWVDGLGGLQNVSLENPSSDRIAIKIKCSDNILYRVNPVYTIIEPQERITIDILRDAGTQKTDKLVFVLTKVNGDVKNSQAHFASNPKRQQMLLLPLIGASAVY